MMIIPAILEQSTDAFIKRIHELSPYFSRMHIDIADGQFVPNKTIQIKDIRETINNHQPTISHITFDFHLMVHDYTQELIHLQQLTSHITIGTIFIHLAPFLNYQLLITHYQYGLVLNPEESVSANWETIKQFKIVQLMTVNPCFQGAPFIPSVFRKIEELKNLGYEGKIPQNLISYVSAVFLKENTGEKLAIFKHYRINF